MKKQGSELYYLDRHGQRQDARLHADMLDNKKAQQAICKTAIERAVKRGMSEAHAERLYGWRENLEGPPSGGHEDEATAEYVNIDEARVLATLAKAKAQSHKLVAVAQKVYDGWVQDEDDDLNGGGICHLIAEAFCEVLGKAGVDAMTQSSSAEVHVYTLFRCKEGIYELDLPYRLYETGGGYTWHKKPGVKFEPDDLYFSQISPVNTVKEFNLYDDRGSDLWVARGDHIERADAVNFVEKQHPRAKDGEFTKKGAGAADGDAKVETSNKLVAAKVGEDGKPQLPEHIAKLKLPPAWTDLKYNPDPNAALLAIGKDAKGRAQYVYSDEHVSKQSMLKFQRIKELDNQYDIIQTKNDEACKSDNPKLRAHAACLDLIMRTGLRPGSDTDTKAEKQAYGATTLRGKHVVKEDDGSVVLRFVGKKGVDLAVKVHDRDLGEQLLSRAEKAGPDGKLFEGVSDASLRDYSHSIGGKGYKVKDFRTLRGTRAALKKIAEMPTPVDAKSFRKSVMDVAKHVAHNVLHNQPTVALQSYISPEVFTDWAAKAGVQK